MASNNINVSGTVFPNTNYSPIVASGGWFGSPIGHLGNLPYTTITGSGVVGGVMNGHNSILQANVAQDNTIRFNIDGEEVIIVKKDKEKGILIEWPSGNSKKFNDKLETALQESLEELGLKAMFSIIMSKVSRKLDDTINKKIVECMKQSGFNL